MGYCFLTPAEEQARAAWRRGRGRSRAAARRRARRREQRWALHWVGAALGAGAAARRGYSCAGAGCTRVVLG